VTTCPVETLAGTQDVLGSPWVAYVNAEVYSGMLASNTSLGNEKIWLKNRLSGEEILIAEGDPPGNTLFKSSQRGELEITIPNQSGIVPVSNIVDGVNVVFHFSPNYDPDDRIGFLSWNRDPHSKEGIIWYCKNIYDPSSNERKSVLHQIFPGTCPKAPQ
jgi:hypothetical protein